MKRRTDLGWGLAFGLVFGFLLQKGGVTRYDVIIDQLLLRDFTVLKIMLTAVLVGMVGLHAMKSRGRVRLDPKPGSWGKNAVGGLVFGLGFALLGYCPGTVAGAIGNGSLDALAAGLTGIVLGSGVLAAIYPRLEAGMLRRGVFRHKTLPESLGVGDWVVIVPLAALIVLLLVLLERAGL